MFDTLIKSMLAEATTQEKMKEEFSKLWDSFIVWLPKAALGAVKFLLAIIVGALIIKLIIMGIRKLLHKTKLDMIVISFILSLIKVGLIILLIIIIFNILHWPVGALAGAIGGFGVVLGIALRDSMSSIASGIMIIVNKPFRKDDLVEINGILGKVTEIKMMTTELVTTDNRKIVMPNNLVSTSSIINISTYDRRRLDITVGVDYSTDLQKAKKVLLDLVAKEERILVDPEPVVFISEKGASSIDFIVRFWVKADDYWGVMWDYNEAVVERFRKEDISIPFNQLDVNLKMPTEWNNPEFNIMEKKFNSKFEKHLEKGAKKEQKYHDKIKEKNDTNDGK